MKVHVVGGGPAGLYFAYLMNRDGAGHDITVFEQNPRDATYGFGVVFSRPVMDRLEAADAILVNAIRPEREAWDDLTIVHRGERIPIDGNGFASISRLALLRCLHGLCESAGVDLRFGTTLISPDDLNTADLVVGADGVNSVVRHASQEAFRPSIGASVNRFIWYGTTKVFDTLTLTFRHSEAGAFVAHHYRYSPTMSTFIVECGAAAWAASGLGEMTPAESLIYCQQVFADDLDGHPLLANKSEWRTFPLVANVRWWDGHTVLLGDALRTVHFSIGSGTRLALEDAMALYQALSDADGGVAGALRRFEERRRPGADAIVEAAVNSASWYEKFDTKMHLGAYDFAYDYLTRTGRVSNARLREIAPRFMAAFEAQAARPLT